MLNSHKLKLYTNIGRKDVLAANINLRDAFILLYVLTYVIMRCKHFLKIF